MNTWTLALDNLTRTAPPLPPEVVGTKQCSANAGCGKVLPLSEFSISFKPNGTSYYRYVCKKCAVKNRRKKDGN